MEKKVIRLTESDLHKIIKESVKKIISESNVNSYTWDMIKEKFDENSIVKSLIRKLPQNDIKCIIDGIINEYNISDDILSKASNYQDLINSINSSYIIDYLESFYNIEQLDNLSKYIAKSIMGREFYR